MLFESVTIFHDNMELKEIAKAFYKAGRISRLDFIATIKSASLRTIFDTQAQWDNECINSPMFMAGLKDPLMKDLARHGVAFLQELLICLKLEIVLSRHPTWIVSDGAYKNSYMALLDEVMAFVLKECVGKELKFDLSSDTRIDSFIQHIAFNGDWNKPQFTGRLRVADQEENFVVNEYVTEITFSKYWR